MEPTPFPGITEPAGSATWHVGDLTEPQLDALEEIVHKGLRESVAPGAQNPDVPFGVPSPVGPSYPAPAVQRYVPPQLPFEPDVTS